MKNIFLFILLIFYSTYLYSACDDQPTNEVDWTNCNFIENLDLSGAGMANSQLSGVKAVFLDLDGTIYLGGNLIDGALDFLQRCEEKGVKLYFLSNQLQQNLFYRLIHSKLNCSV